MPRETDFDIPRQTLDIVVDGDTFKLDMYELGKLVRIDPNQLDREMREQVSMFVWVATLASNANSNAEQKKHELALLLSELVKDVRRGYGDAKPPAKDIIEHEAKEDASYVERLDEYLDARRIADLADVGREAVRMRQFMLTALNNNRRAEDAANSATAGGE